MHSRVFAFAPGCGKYMVNRVRLHLPVQADKKTLAKNAIKGAPQYSIVASHWGYLSPAAALIGFQLPAPAS